MTLKEFLFSKDFSYQLIKINVILFFLSLIFYDFSSATFQIPDYLALNSDLQVVLYHPWTVFTYAFFHFDLWHLFFNLVMLYFTSQLFLTFFSQKQLLALYLYSCIFAGIMFVLAYQLIGYQGTIIGASAGIMALLAAVTTYRPQFRVQLPFIGVIPIWYFTTFILLIDLLQIKLSNTGGHISHLFGAFFGYIFIQLLINGYDLSKIPSIFSRKKKPPFKNVYRNYNNNTSETTSSSIKIISKEQKQIDEILEKIGKSGYESLSKDEKEFLFKIGKQ